MLSPDFLFPCFLVFPPANPSNFSYCKCFSIRIEVLKYFAFPVDEKGGVAKSAKRSEFIMAAASGRIHAALQPFSGFCS